MTAGIAQSEYRPAADLKVRGSNPGGGIIFPAVQTGPMDHSASCVVITGFFPGVKRLERDADTHLPLVSVCECVGTVTPSPF